MMIAIEAQRHGESARIIVSDTGSGIPAEALTRVWERFFRAEPSRERRGEAGGVGLGLAIVRAIVEAHGGTITIASTVGAGTTVTLDLPIEQAAVGVRPSLTSEATPVSAATARAVSRES